MSGRSGHGIHHTRMNTSVCIKLFFLMLLGALLTAYAQAQNPADTLKPVQVVKPDSLGEDIYQMLRPYQLLLIGETHGTNESANLVTGLLKIMLAHGDSVQIGLEIKLSQMNDFHGNLNDATLLTSEFFSGKNHNPQASEAWAKLILYASKNTRCKLFFFDVVYTDDNRLYPRDSAMYLNIKEKMKEHPSWKTIVLTGDIHSRTSPYNNIPTLGYYLSTDAAIAAFSPIISIVHRYKTGELWDTSGLLPQEYEKWHEDLPYIKTKDLKSYLLLLPGKTNNTSSCIYYTEKATRSRIIWND